MDSKNSYNLLQDKPSHTKLIVKKTIMQRLELTGKSNLFNPEFYEEYIYKFYITNTHSTPDDMSKEFVDHLQEGINKIKKQFLIYLILITIFSQYFAISMFQYPVDTKFRYVGVLLSLTSGLIIASFVIYFRSCYQFKPNLIMTSYALLTISFILCIIKTLVFQLMDRPQLIDNIGENEENESYFFLNHKKIITFLFIVSIGMQIYLVCKIKGIKIDMNYLLSMVKAV